MKNKVKEMIKKGNEEKDSLFGKIKSQAAMEYLMTYGWAILIIALTLGVLYSLGIMNPKNFTPRAPPGSCFVFRPNGPGTTDYVSLQGTCGYLPMYVASFNGVNGYVEVPNSNSLNPTQEMTIGAWVLIRRGVTSGTWNAIVGKNPYSNGYLMWLETPMEPCALFYVGGTRYDVRSNIQIQLNKWYYLVATRSLDGYQKFYINGNLVKTVGPYSGNLTTNAGPLDIAGQSPQYMNGSIANVQIYNTALTPQEIQYLYQQGLGGGPVRLQNLVAWWPLNGDAKDYSGNNNHGTIYGGVTFVQNYNPP